VNVFIPYNKKYILGTYHLDGHHAAFIEDTVLRNLIKRLIKSKLVNRVDVYTQDESTLDGIHSKKLNFVKSISNEFESSEEIIKDYLSVTMIKEPVVYYNLMFPFTEIAKLKNALESIETGKYESATGVIEKGVVWSHESVNETDPLGLTPRQSEISTGLDVGSFCIVRPENILSGCRRTTPPVMLVPLASRELVNMRTGADKELYQLIISSGMPL
jgi:hypothetical protein